MRTFALAMLGLVAASASPAQNVAARLDSAMRIAEGKGFSGGVRVQRDGALLLEQGYGLANRERRIAFSPATVVQIGSNTKDFTAVAILQLQERGLLSVRDSLGRYFPNAPADKRGITIQQLLDHRAGFPLGIGGDFEPIGRAALVDSAMRSPLLFAPGTRQSYSNTGFSLLAAIVEQVTGKSYDVYLSEAILSPLGLRHTGFLLPGFEPDELAHGYLPSGGDEGTMLQKPHARDGPYWNLRGNGGMLSTVSDMHAFYEALFESDRLLTPAARGSRFDPNEAVGLAGSDGVSFFLYERDPRSRTELIIASTNAAMKAPVIRRELAQVLGLPAAEGDDEPVAHREGGKPAPPAMAAMLTGLITTINAGDSAALRRFVTTNFTSDAGAPTVDERVQRIGRLRERLGALKIVRMETFPQGPMEIGLETAQQGAATLKVMIEPAPPHRILGMQILVGGG
jgi:CubicO group peptidase (beta-lactamase class C family)